MLVAGPQDRAVLLPAISTATLFADRIRAFAATAPAAVSTAWPLANDAYLLPFEVGFPMLVKEIFFQTGTLPGTANFDLGIYDEGFARIISLGATACVNTTDAIMPAGGGDIADVTLTRGRYYIAMSAAAITITVRAVAPANGLVRAMGVVKMAAAYPLPPTITPVSMGTTAFMPVMGIATVTNLL